MGLTKANFVEGLIGSCKSTTAQFLTGYLNQQRIAARFVPEGGRDHPLQVARLLPHPFQMAFQAPIWYVARAYRTLNQNP